MDASQNINAKGHAGGNGSQSVPGSSNAPVTGGPSGPASAPMSNTGSKGRSGGSKLKSLFSRLGGHQKNQQKSNNGAVAIRDAGTAEPVNNSNIKNNNAASKSKQTVQDDMNAGNISVPSAQDAKRASKIGSHRLRNNSKNSKAAVNAMTGPVSQTSSQQPPLQINSVVASTAASAHGSSQQPLNDASQSSSPSDYFGRSALRQTSGDDISCDTNGGMFNRNSDLIRPNGTTEDYEDDEYDGADADASIRPITPSSIDASSSFTGSTSLHSMAPTSRTFKSFRTGHSKASASTKPTMLQGAGTSIQTQAGSTGGGAVSVNAVSPLNGTIPLQQQNISVSPPSSVRQQHNKREAPLGQSLTFQSDKGKERQVAPDPNDTAESGITRGTTDMHDPEANRIATSLHRAEGTIDPVAAGSSRSSLSEIPGALALALQQSSLQHARQIGPKASPLRNSFTGQVSTLATAPSLSAAAEEDGETASQAAHQMTPREESYAGEPIDNAHNDTASAQLNKPELREGHTNLIRSSASITFSKLPPATPTSISSAQTGNGMESSGASTAEGHPSMSGEDVEGIYHYPRHSAPDPKNNPRASSPPPDNASMLTLASSTGGRAPSVYTAASRYRDGIAAGSIGGGTPSIADTHGYKYRNTANEDASIRAIAPSRRESSDSINSRWSAAMLSQKEGSFHTAGAAPAANSATVNGGTVNNGELAPDGASYKRRTPSLRTVATTASSYYAAPSHATAELRA